MAIMLGVGGTANGFYLTIDAFPIYMGTFGGCATGRPPAMLQLAVILPAQPAFR